MTLKEENELLQQQYDLLPSEEQKRLDEEKEAREEEYIREVYRS